MTSFVRFHPDYRVDLESFGLRSAPDFLSLQGPIVSGHPERHVLRVELGNDGAARIKGYLKKQHRVGWRERWKNAWAGFGLVSRSVREALVLLQVAQAKQSVTDDRQTRLPHGPTPLAWGEHDGQAFLLLREATGYEDLRNSARWRAPELRRRVAEGFGRQLAHLHAAGFQHADLYAKHVLVDDHANFCLLDWQRARRLRHVTLRQRQHDLMLLDATLAPGACADRDRLACLRGYLDVAGRKHLFACWARSIRRQSERLRRQPRIREMQQPPLGAGKQDLVWLDGEALCVTEAFREELRGHDPMWLPPRADEPLAEEVQVPLPGGRWARLARRVRRGWGILFGRRSTTPEMEQAILLFRLERHGVPAPRLLAFGQQRTRSTQAAFVLAEPAPCERSLALFLAEATDVRDRLAVLQEAGHILRQLHDAGYALGTTGSLSALCGVSATVRGRRVALQAVCGLPRCKRPWPELARQDLPRLWRREGAHLRMTECWRFLKGYLDGDKTDRSRHASVRRSSSRINPDGELRPLLAWLLSMLERQVSA